MAVYNTPTACTTLHQQSSTTVRSGLYTLHAFADQAERAMRIMLVVMLQHLNDTKQPQKSTPDTSPNTAQAHSAEPVYAGRQGRRQTPA